jgi:hypothetical protein
VNPVILLLISRKTIVFFPCSIGRWHQAKPPSASLAKIDACMKNGARFSSTLRDGVGFDAFAGNLAHPLALRSILESWTSRRWAVPPEHVLTCRSICCKAFRRYDLQLWVESSDSQGATTGNADGVSSIIIGSNDYAAVWAQDQNGEGLYAAVPGGERQREYAYRSGINIVMYALTGNYKADQVHIPSLLERLGQ